jgi:hypothetical protein
MDTFSGESGYTLRDPERFPMNLSRAAADLGITIQRLTRIVKTLSIPVTRNGYSLLIDSAGFLSAKRALKEKKIKRGRRPKTVA